jgi:hypothetical protein
MTGRVLGHDGRVLPASHLEVRRIGYIDAIAELELGVEGQFAVELPGPGAYVLTAAGVDHAQIDRHILVGEAPVEIDLRLGTYARTDTGDALAIRLRWVDEHGDPVGSPIDTSATRTVPGEEHRVSVEVPADARALQYQLTGLTSCRSTPCCGCSSGRASTIPSGCSTPTDSARSTGPTSPSSTPRSRPCSSTTTTRACARVWRSPASTGPAAKARPRASTIATGPWPATTPWPMPWRHAWLDAEAWRALEQRWTINAVPTVVLVDAEGIIVELDGAVRREQLLPRLEQFLGE